jgi:hypothetical protein
MKETCNWDLSSGVLGSIRFVKPVENGLSRGLVEWRRIQGAINLCMLVEPLRRPVILGNFLKWSYGIAISQCVGLLKRRRIMFDPRGERHGSRTWWVFLGR